MYSVTYNESSNSSCAYDRKFWIFARLVGCELIDIKFVNKEIFIDSGPVSVVFLAPITLNIKLKTLTHFIHT